MDTFYKTPYEKRPIFFSFITDLMAGEVITSAVTTCINTLTGTDTKTAMVYAEANLNIEMRATLQNGSVGDVHQIQCLVTTNLGNKFSKDIMLIIIENISKIIEKQPAEKYIVQFDMPLESLDSIASVTASSIKISDNTSSDVVAFAMGSANAIRIALQNGIDGECYRISIRYITSLGYYYEIFINVKVQEL